MLKFILHAMANNFSDIIVVFVISGRYIDTLGRGARWFPRADLGRAADAKDGTRKSRIRSVQVQLRRLVKQNQD